MFSIATAPAKQSVSETISVLSGRLSSATLLEDRRAAILGLRSFAKEYPASVSSGALRSLIGSLSKDGEDVDTVKVVLETLLMLFNPNEDSPEASEEIALWMADEFTQRLENITLLLDFLETNDFYSRLYSLQLLTTILAARTERTEECIFTAPLGISRLVAILDDSREAVRNEAISLLTYLTPTSPDIQKLVAFENAFERLFKIVEDEGGLAEGGQVVEDCLMLLSNLLRLNAHNQTLFRESLCTAVFSRILGAVATVGEEDDMAEWAQAQRNRNVYGFMFVVRLFLVPGAVGTVQNQAEFWRHGVLYHSLQLAFNRAFEVPVRAQALTTCAAIIYGNATLQENFAQLRVPSPLDDETTRASSSDDSEKKGAGGHGNGHGNGSTPKPREEVYVIDGLLDLSLSVHDPLLFDVRLAASECLKAYFANHEVVRMHFLQRAIDGHNSGAEETANVLTTLLQPPSSTDPYRQWFAAVIMLHLLYDNPKAKALAMTVTEGDESEGEEVVTSIQTITAQLISGASKGSDIRVLIGSLMLLICWLFEALDGVNDFLGEGSNVQGLIQLIVKPTDNDVMVQGLAALLLGVVYEFSTKDSAIPRQKLHEVLVGRMGRDRYMDKLDKLRTCTWLREYEVLPQKLDPRSDQKLPDVYFDATFVDFFKDNYSRLLKAIDRDPGMEISFVTDGVQQGISRELVDTLRAELGEKDRVLREAQDRIGALENALGQERVDHKRTREATKADLAKAQGAQDVLARKHEEQLQKTRAEHQKDKMELQRQMEQARRASDAEAARVQRRLEGEMADLKATSSRLEVDLLKANTSKAQELQSARDTFKARLAEAAETAADADKRAKALEGTLAAEQKRVAELREALEAAEEYARDLAVKLQVEEDKNKELVGKVEAVEKDAKKVEALVAESREEKKATQAELDDLLMVFADLEEKADKYKARLKELGEQISDDEDDDDDDNDEGVE